MQALSDECLSLLTPSCNHISFEKLRRRRMCPCVRLSPHADYLHPSIECAVPLAGKGRGTRVRSVDDSGAASSSEATLPPHSHTLVMSMKAIAVELHSDEGDRSEMLMRKLMDQLQLARQVRRLFSSPEVEAQRSEWLTLRSALTVWRESPATKVTASELKMLTSFRPLLLGTLSHNPFDDNLDSLRSHGCRWRWSLVSSLLLQSLL